LQVKDIMDKNPCLIEEDKRLLEAVETMEECRVEGLAVVNKEGKVVGVITEGDIVRAILLTYEELAEEGFHLEEAERRAAFALNKKVEEVMSKAPLVVKEEVPLMKVLSLMAIERVGCLPVVNGEGRLTGTVRRRELLKAFKGI